MASVELIHEQVSGRTRFKVDGLKNDGLKRRFLEHQLSSRSMITQVRANDVTGNLLVCFNSNHSSGSIAELVEDALDQFERHQSVLRQSTVQDADAAAAVGAGRTDQTRPSPSGPDAEPPWLVDWHRHNPKEVSARLGTCPRGGLDPGEARSRLAQYGANRLPQSEPRTGLDIFLAQFNSLPVYLLGAAAGVSLLTGGLLDAAIIMGVVAANAVIGYATESRAEKTIGALKELVRPSAEVIRGGEQHVVPSEEVVPGDLLVLKPGIYVAADCRIIKASYLSIDESMLTGESMPAEKSVTPIQRDDLPLADRRNMAYMGTLVTGGQGIAVVVAIGRWTQIGRLQWMLDQTEPPETPIERQLGRLGDQLVLMCLGICGVVFLIGMLRGYGWLRMLRMAISLAASAVPEGLPAAATINFAMGIHRMRKHHILVRHLQALETLGAVQVLCLDKTGTLTLNRMAVQQLFVGMEAFFVRDGVLMGGSGPAAAADRLDLQQLAAGCVLCNEIKISGRRADGKPDVEGSATEKALLFLALDMGLALEDFLSAYRLMKMSHRSEARLFMSTLHQAEDSSRMLSVKGSPPEVLAMCDRQIIGGDIVPLSASDRLAIESENERMAGKALRVLGFAYRLFENGQKGDLSNGLIWIGLVGLSDPVRPGVAELIQVFHRAGVETVMITGDQHNTAYAVANELDLSCGKPLEILDSSRFSSVRSDTMQALALKVNVYSRVSPAHKLKIVQALQAAGKTVAMTGDGINDGLALKAADIGITMGRTGTDLARDVADIILEEDQLELLAWALSDGRTTYGNIRKSVHFFLSTNISEIMLMFAAMSLGLGFPLTVMQLLWINLISDIFPGLALAMEKPEADVLTQPPRDGHAPLFDRADFKKMVRESAAITGGALAAYGFGLARYGPGLQSTALAFQSLTIGQLLHAFSCRSEHATIFQRGALPPNPYLMLALGGSLALQSLTLFFPPLARLLGIAKIDLADLAIVACTALAPLLLNESNKSGQEERHHG